MIYRHTRCVVADNSGAKVGMIIGIHNKSKIATIGTSVTVTVKDTKPGAKVKVGELCRAVVVRCKKESLKRDGRFVRFDDNAIVLVHPDRKPIGSRVLGPVGADLRTDAWIKVASIASKLL